MNIDQMKNIVIIKDIPSNIVDEAIVILKNNITIKKKVLESKKTNKSMENENNDFAINEAENIVKEYIKSIENTNNKKNNINGIVTKYHKLKIYSFLLSVIAIIGIIINIVK